MLVVSIVFVTTRLGDARSVFVLQIIVEEPSDHLKFLLRFPIAMIFKILFIKADLITP